MPDTGLFLMWKVVIPALPLLFMVAPGVWRNICPLATSNQTPRALGLTKALNPPNWLKEYGYVIAITAFVGFVILRKVGLDDSGPLSALLLLGAMTGAFAGGMVLKGKSGWCSTMCPLLPVQRIYGQTPFALVGNNHCQPCVGCAKNCYDFNPRAAYLADLNDNDGYWSGRRRFFVGAFPGLVLGFFATAEGDVARDAALHRGLARRCSRSRRRSSRSPTHTITSTFGAIAFGIFYWYVAGQLEPATWPLRAAAIALAAVWLVRTWRKEKPFLAQAAAPIAGAAGAVASARSPSNRALKCRRARSPLRPRGQDRRRQGGPVACWRSPSPTG